MVFSLLNQLQIFWKLYLIELLQFLPAEALDIFKAFGRIWYAGLLHELKSYVISGQIFGLISSFYSNRRFWIVLDETSSQEYPVNARFPQGGHILDLTPFLLYINDLPDDLICNTAIYAGHTTQFFKCDLYQKLELMNIYLIYETPWTGAESGLLISMLEILSLRL